MSRWAVGAGWALLAALAAGMLAWTWGTWPHSFVDFGRELYVPWRLAESEVLYRDIAWFNGPLSAYWNALLFWVFGPGLWVLVVANLVDVAVLTFVLHDLLRRVGDRIAAITSCGVFLCLFAFSRIDGIGNDNYLTPYSHELTHGLLLSLAALWAFAAFRDTPLRRAFATGGLLGLVALTKPEVALATGIALFTATLLEHYRTGGSHSERPRAWGVAAAFLAAAFAPGFFAFALLALAMPPSQALLGTLGGWPAVVQSDVTSQYFYRATIGFVDLTHNVIRVLEWTLAYGAVALPITLATLRMRKLPGSPDATTGGWMLFTGVFALATSGVLFAGDALAVSWPEFPRPLPIVLGTLAVVSFALAMRTAEEEGEEKGDPVLRTALLVFATVLLAKVALRARLDQYGFALAMPGTLLLVTAGVCWLPRWIGSRGGDSGVARAAFIGVVTGVGLSLFPTLSAHNDERFEPLGAGSDGFLADEATAPILDAVLRELERKRVHETLAVLPEGVMLNYLARRVNPTGHVNFMPPELLIFGEDQIVEAFEENPPDWIALTHKDTSEYGVGYFGRGYARDLRAWVDRHYEPFEQFGDPPLQPGSRFGVALLKKRRSATR